MEIACQSGGSPRPSVIRRHRLQALPLLLPLMAVLLLVGCGPDSQTLAERERQAEQQRLLNLCRRVRPTLPQQLSRFAAAQQELAAVRSNTYLPSPGPKPLDPEEQRRLTIDDQQIEQELHDQQVEAWRRTEAQRRARWEREQVERERRASRALDQAADSLRQLHADLLVPGSSPRLNAGEVERFRDCNAEQFR